MYRSSQLACLASLVSLGLSQNISPFSVTGGLDGCSAGTEYNAGGSISVNAFDITVPKNLIVQFPTVFAPFKDLCGAGAGGFETTVVGNIVDGRAIAGQIVVAQRFGLEGSQGYIAAINQDGSLQIQGGPRVTINDPDGLFGPKVTTHPMWVADTASPSVTSFSGYPMCIPYSGNTESCLSSNRKDGQSFSPPDPLRMVPLKVGDFIEYSGLKTGSNDILASEITCISLHLTTQGGTDVPNYIRVEDMLIGVPDTAANVEFADIKVVGFLSSCANAIVTISAVDVDPCTGKETYREIGTTTPKAEVRCKWETKIASPAKAPFTREYRITTNTPVKETKDGIQGGEYIAMVSEWIFPEVDVPGTNPPPFPFKDIADVAKGTVLDGKQYGQLSPFPGVSPGAPSKQCSPSDLIIATPTPSAAPSATPSATTPSDSSATPTASVAPVTPPSASVAAVANVQRVGTNFVLTGSNTESKYTNADLNFQWNQASPASPSPTIANANAPTATVTAGKVTTETSFVYELVISLKSDPSVSSKANVTVKVNPTIADLVNMDTYTWDSKQSGTITVACSSNVINGDSKKMQLWLNTGATKIDMTQNGAGKWFYSSRSVARPTNLKCVSDLKGESTQRTGTQTTARRRRYVSW